jgi:hypothetical protein
VVSRLLHRVIRFLMNARRRIPSAYLATVGSQTRDPGRSAMSEALLKKLDKAHLCGFKVTLVGVPDRIGQP